jgi:hypothetical protein
MVMQQRRNDVLTPVNITFMHHGFAPFYRLTGLLWLLFLKHMTWASTCCCCCAGG